ncbi:MAG TPA: hypothetical protein VG937_36730 [Polyangiaceae bacterium]|nr:hypothetical protein [Polyangiaceae bacterium]
MTHAKASVLGALLGAFLLAAPAPAAAQQAAVMGERTVAGPNRDLLHTGAWTLGLSYVPALVVAIESSENADKNLYIPVAGPWMDVATRDCPTCEHETANKVLLVTDGIFQGIGALQLIGSFLFVETRTNAALAKPHAQKASAFQIAPTRLPEGGYGLAAHGAF